MTDSLLTATAPVFTVDGQVKGQLARDVTRLEIEEDTSGMKRLMLRLIAQGPQQGTPEEEVLYLNGTILDFGKRLQVSIGPEESARTVFDGFISGLQGCFHEAQEPEVVTFAEDRLMRLRTEEEVLYLNGSILDFGKRLQVSIGPEESARTVFDGFISGLQGCFHEAQEPEVVTFAEDRLMRLRTTRSIALRTLDRPKRSELLRGLAPSRRFSSWPPGRAERAAGW